MTTILSIQSSVAYGHVGNSAATFPLMRSGVEVWPVLTVHFSNHTGYGEWRGPLLAAEDVAEVIRGIDDRGVLPRVDAVLSGYQGAEAVGAVVLDAVELVKQRSPRAIYCCDPVMGDVGRGFFVRPGIPEFMRDNVVAEADIMTPNVFELEYLTGRRTRTLADVLDAVEELRSQGPETVLVTSVMSEDLPEGRLHMLAVDGQGAHLVETPLLDRQFVGSGDITTAVFLAHWLNTRDLGPTLGRTASAVYSILEATTASGNEELQLVAAQDDIVAPRHTFEAARLS